MTNFKIEVAKDFISLHKHSEWTDWQLMAGGSSKEEVYINIYNRLRGGVYGEVRRVTDGGLNEDMDGNTLEIEIDSVDHKDGYAYVFNWSTESETDTAGAKDYLKKSAVPSEDELYDMLTCADSLEVLEGEISINCISSHTHSEQEDAIYNALGVIPTPCDASDDGWRVWIREG